MELNGCTNYEQDALVSELSQGIELSKQLKAQMHMDIQSGEPKGMLVERIHSCFERALIMTLNWGGSMEQSHQHVVPSNTMPGSPLSVIGSPNKSEDFSTGFHVQQQQIKGCPRKRKMMPTQTAQVKANSNNAAEGPAEDGCSWRKYGQKDILGAKHPRSYYRCTYRNMQGCIATKQVQRNDEDPMKFDITYKGVHTCTLAPRSKSAPTSPEKSECNKQSNFYVVPNQQQPDILLNFQTGLRVDTQSLENQDSGFFFPTSEPGYRNDAFKQSALCNSHPYNSYPPQSFIPSPANSETTYFSTSPATNTISTFGGVHYGQHSESELTEIISATTSGNNSPIMGMDFPLNQWELDSGFLFDDKHAFSTSFSQDKE